MWIKEGSSSLSAIEACVLTQSRSACASSSGSSEVEAVTGVKIAPASAGLAAAVVVTNGEVYTTAVAAVATMAAIAFVA